MLRKGPFSVPIRPDPPVIVWRAMATAGAELWHDERLRTRLYHSGRQNRSLKAATTKNAQRSITGGGNRGVTTRPATRPPGPLGSARGAHRQGFAFVIVLMVLRSRDGSKLRWRPARAGAAQS